MTENINSFECAMTDQRKKITIQGETLNFTVYRIPLDALVYNVKNGRIATYISKYQTDNGELNQNNVIELNNILGKFIRESNPTALDKTKDNIKKFGQKQPGVVLKNGIVIDGNRRFTCLRELESEGKIQYFDAVILSDDYSARDIKSLELNLQHAEERPVDYNPIDDLVDIYRDVVADKLFTVEQYAFETNKKMTEIRNSVAAAVLMVEFLEFINHKEAYHIARDMTLDGPLRELVGIFKKIPKDNHEDIKPTMFTALMTTTGDKTRAIREMGKHIIHTEKHPRFIDEYEVVVKHVYEVTRSGKKSENVSQLVELVQGDKELVDSGRKIIESYVNTSKIKNARNEPLELLSKSYENFISIDAYTINQLDNKSKTRFIKELDSLAEEITKIRAKINAY